MPKVRKLYYPMKGSGEFKYFVQVWEETSPENCSICQQINNFLKLLETAPVEELKMLRKSTPLAKHNLETHLKTGKHWEILNDLSYYIKKGK